MPITVCNRPFALEAVSRRETAVHGQTGGYTCPLCATGKKTKGAYLLESDEIRILKKVFKNK